MVTEFYGILKLFISKIGTSGDFNRGIPLFLRLALHPPHTSSSSILNHHHGMTLGILSAKYHHHEPAYATFI
eukprot:scaffold25389_cov71-Cyclotella_meneghiniana.AAC.8